MSRFGLSQSENTAVESGRGRKAVMLLTAAITLAATSTPASAQVRASSLNVDGLNYESELTALFLGDFANARLKRDDMRFLGLLNGYIGGFSRLCAANLPRNKVQITEQRCVQTSTPTNIYGNPVGGSSCSRYQTFGTGRYADPVLYSMAGQLERNLAPKLLADGIGLSGKDPLASSRQMVDVTLSFGDDFTTLFRKNSCGSAGIKRLQANLTRFGKGQSPLKLAGGTTLSDVRGRGNGGGAFKDSNYGRLIDDLVKANAQGWSFNRYIAGSVSQVTVQSRDSQGRPARVNASYSFSGFSGRQNGSVLVTFDNGLPKCLYFFDARNTCRLPSRGVITAYEKGAYR